MNIPQKIFDQTLNSQDGIVYQKKFLQGNEAIAEGMLAAGSNFFAGYPITPSTEIAEILSIKLPRTGGKFIQMEDEIASIGAILGASLAGARSLTSTSGPGFSLMQELIGYGGMAQIPCVIVNVMRCGPSTGLPTSPSQGDVQQALWGTHGDHPTLVVIPGTVPEMYYLSIWSMNIAQKLRTPVILLPDEIIGHMREQVLIPPKQIVHKEERKKPSPDSNNFHPFTIHENNISETADLGDGFRFNVTGLVHDQDGFPVNSSERGKELVQHIIEKIKSRSDELVFYEETETSDADCIIIAYGSTARSAENALHALRADGRKVGLFRIITLAPFPTEQIKELSQNCNNFLLAEMNYGQLTSTIQATLSNNSDLHCLHKWDGEPITPKEFIEKIKTII